MKREYFERNYDYTSEDIEEGIVTAAGEVDSDDPNEEDVSSDLLGVKESTKDTGEKKSAVRDRSVTDDPKNY